MYHAANHYFTSKDDAISKSLLRNGTRGLDSGSGKWFEGGRKDCRVRDGRVSGRGEGWRAAMRDR